MIVSVEGVGCGGNGGKEEDGIAEEMHDERNLADLGNEREKK